MSHAHNGREANLLAAFGLAVADRMDAATAGRGRPGAEALVALDGSGGGAAIGDLARIVGLSHSGAVRLVDRDRKSVV
jgi:MarR family transcriptional repressor of emrRAB